MVTFVFATYFVRAVAPDPASGTAAWAWAQTAAGLTVAASAAPLGALADRGGYRRPLLALATALMVVCTAALWFVRPGNESERLALVLVATATVAFETATVFYNAMLPDIAPPGRIGRISGLAWGCGYAGGLVALTLCLLVLVNPKPPLFGLSADAAEPVRATALFAAAWIAVFAWPVLVFGPTERSPGYPAPSAQPEPARRGGIRAALRHVAAAPALRGFLLARMLYSDGMTTLFAFGAIFAAGTFDMDASEVLLLGIALNISAGVGAGAFALVEDRLGSRPTVLVAVAALALLGTLALLAPDARTFWAAAIGLGLFVGPAQAASRSLMARISPPGSRNAMFGLYALSGRATGFAGPAALGIVTAFTGSQRAGMAVVVVLLAAGWALLAATPINERTLTAPTNG